MTDDGGGGLIAQRYRLDTRIGAGGMGEVWRATDLQLGRQVAVKLLLRETIARPDAAQRFEREARVGAALNHPNVVHTLDFGSDRGRMYLVMQLVPGRDLFQHAAAMQPMPGAPIISYGYQISDALAAAHAMGLVHRDLKPENVLVEQTHGETILRVADFGMAYVIGALDPREGRLTQDGRFGGTPEYMAPEYTLGQPVGPPADVYALGCMLFELANAVPPFTGAVGKVFAAHLYSPIPRLRESRPDLPAGLDELVWRMLAKDPNDRPTSDAVRRRLAALDAGSLDPRARARDGVVSDRGARMITMSPEGEKTDAPKTGAAIAIIGALDREVIIAIGAAGMTVVEDPATADACVVVGGSLEAIAGACAHGKPVVADADSGDFKRISSLLRLGVAEVVLAPIVPSAVVRKLVRATRKRMEKV